MSLGPPAGAYVRVASRRRPSVAAASRFCDSAAGVIHAVSKHAPPVDNLRKFVAHKQRAHPDYL